MYNVLKCAECITYAAERVAQRLSHGMPKNPLVKYTNNTAKMQYCFSGTQLSFEGTNFWVFHDDDDDLLQ